MRVSNKEFEMAAQEMIAALRDSGYVVKVWSEVDIQESLIQRGESRTDVINMISEHVVNSSGWNALGDVSEDEWGLIDFMIEEAKKELGL